MFTSTHALALAAVVWMVPHPAQDPSPPRDARSPAEKALDDSLIDRGCVIMLNRRTLAVVDVGRACGETADRCIERARVAQSDREAEGLRDLAGQLKARKESCVALATELDRSVSEFESMTCQKRAGKLARPGAADEAFSVAIEAIKKSLNTGKGDYDELRAALDEGGLAIPRWPKID